MDANRHPDRDDDGAAAHRPAGSGSHVDTDRPLSTDREVLRDERERVVDRQREQFGGIKVGSCFFGWLTATGTAVLLTALAGAVGVAVGNQQGVDPTAPEDAQTIGLVGGIVLLVVVLVAYFCGGYVAGRMARFSGAKQGLGVWLWAIVVAVLVAVAGLVVGDRLDLQSQISGLPQIPLDSSSLSTPGVLAAVGVAVVSLGGAVLGGLAGMRYHRRVDAVAVQPEAGSSR